MIDKTEIRRVLLWTISTSVPGTFLGLYLINTFFVPLDGGPVPLPTWIGIALILPSMWMPHLDVQIQNTILGWVVVGICQFVGYGIVVALVRGAYHALAKRWNTQPSPAGDVLEAAPEE